jgi:hypothetical protein
MMKSNHQQALKLSTAFGCEYADALKIWGRRLADGVGPIIAISRKAPRILELGVREGLIPESVLHRVTTERGLHAMLSESIQNPVKVCDDIVIMGSTFRRVGEIAGELCGSDRVTGLPFARSISADSENLSIVKETAPVALSDDVCSSFVLSEVAAFGALDKPYDVEHPILRLDLVPHASPEIIASDLKAWSQKNGYAFYETPRQLLDPDGQVVTHSAWTILLSSPSNSKFHRIHKIRCYMDPVSARLSFVPIATRAATLDEFEASVRRLPSSLVECWNLVTFGTGDSESNLALTNRGRSAVAWAGYLLDLDGLGSVLSRVRLTLLERKLLAAPQSFYFDIFDIQLLTGIGSGEQIKNRLETFVNSVRFSAEPSSSDAKGWQVRPVIPAEYETAYDQAVTDLLEGVVDVTEALEAIFKAQHVAIELESRANDPRNPRRLEFGVPLSYLVERVEAALGPGEELELHRALDSLIDSGVIVPRYLPQSIDGVEVWCRTFRVGEALSMVRGHVAKECFKALSGVHGAQELREVLTEKFFVLVCELEGLFKTPSLITAPDIRRYFHLYGARPGVLAGGRREWFIDWATRCRILQKTERDGEPFYSLDQRAPRYFRDEENPLTNEMRHRLAAIARWTRSANESPGLGGDFLVAITTVESEWAYRRALEAEISGWVNHESWGITAAVHALDDCAESLDAKTKSHTKTILGHLANWIAQAKAKHTLREALPSFVERSDSIWAANSYDEKAITWRNIVRPKWEAHSTRTSQPSNIVGETLNPTLMVLNRFTSLLRNIFSEFAGVEDTRAIPTKDSAQRVIQAIEELPTHIRDNFKEALQGIERVAEATDLETAVSEVHKPASVIADAADCVLSLYPDLSDEPLDPLRVGLFIVMWDVRGSTNAETREDLTRRIVEVNRSLQTSFRHRLIHFDAESTDDGNSAVCQDFETAMSVAKAVATGYAPFVVKIGCNTNLDGTLCRGRSTRRLSGRAFEYTARMMTFFSEIREPSQAWIPDMDVATHQPQSTPTEPKDVSYLIMSEAAYRFASEGEHPNLLRLLAKLPGTYRPRVYGAYSQIVYLESFDPRSAAIQLSLIGET